MPQDDFLHRVKQSLELADAKSVHIRSLFMDEWTKERIVACLAQSGHTFPLSEVAVLRAALNNQVVALDVSQTSV
jgi:hypothetical protein